MVSVQAQKNTIRISFTVIDQDGKETLHRDHCVSFAELKQSVIPALPLHAQEEARKFQEAVVMMGIFD